MNVSTLLAPNPGLYTGPGTNTYVLESEGEALIIDPGPLHDDHRLAIQQAVAGLQPVGVAVTHTHPDHAPLANPLAEHLGVPALGFAPGPGFEPERRLQDAAIMPFGSRIAKAMHTPGHSPDHLCYQVEDLLFSGDHVVGGSTVFVDDMEAYLTSLQRLLELPLRRLYPGHGPQVDRPREVVSHYLEHRRQREGQILEALAAGAATVGEVVEEVYRDVEPALHPLAARSVAAHLRKLAAEERAHIDEKGSESLWRAPVAASRESFGKGGPRA